MTSFWTRMAKFGTGAATALALVLGATPATAARADPCKTNSKSAACKATQTSKAKSTSAKSTSKSTASTSKASATKTTTAKNSKAAASNAKVKVVLRSKKSAADEADRQAASRATAEKTARATASRSRNALAVSAAAAAADTDTPAILSAGTTRAEAAAVRSSIAYVQDLESSTVLFAKNDRMVRPIASISKLMTALVVIDANQPLDEVLEITEDDVDRVRHSPSRLTVGTRLTRADMLHLALMSSENRAAHSLGRYYPGGLPAFARAMNNKAQSLGMYDSHFVEPTGLSSQNVSSPRDLVRMMRAAGQRPLIHRYSTDTEYEVAVRSGRTETFRNTNALVRSADWDIKVSKTGFINEAGECLVMLTRINGRDLAIVLLNSQGKYSRIGDAVRVRRLVQNEVAMM